MREAQVDLTVELGRAMVRSGDLLNLKVGDILPLEKDVNESLIAMVEGVPKFKGRAGMSRGSKAFKVEGFY